MCNCYGCVDGCYEVAEILYDKKYKSVYHAIRENKSKLKQYNTFNELYNSYPMSIEYSLLFYCIEKNHTSCIEKMCSWYSDELNIKIHKSLAKHAINCRNLDCLKIIVDYFGNQYIDDCDTSYGKKYNFFSSNFIKNLMYEKEIVKYLKKIIGENGVFDELYEYFGINDENNIFIHKKIVQKLFELDDEDLYNSDICNKEIRWRYGMDNYLDL